MNLGSIMSPQTHTRGKAMGLRKARAKSRKWYEIKNADGDGITPNGEDGPGNEAELFIYGEIDEFYGVGAEEFNRDLASISAPVLRVRINSPGGILVDGIAIYNALAQHRSDIITQVDGWAGSAASIIMLAGRERLLAGPSAMVMIHDPWGMVLGTADEMRAQAALVDRMADAMAALYGSRTDLTADEARAAMAEETWFIGDEAVDAGFATAVLEPQDGEVEANLSHANFGAYNNTPAILGGPDDRRHQKAIKTGPQALGWDPDDKPGQTGPGPAAGDGTPGPVQDDVAAQAAEPDSAAAGGVALMAELTNTRARAMQAAFRNVDLDA